MTSTAPLSDDALYSALVAAAQDGKADEIVTGMIAMNATAAVLFLRGQISESDGIAQEHQQQAVHDLMLAKAKAHQFGAMAADKLCSPDTEADTKASLAGSIAVAVMASIGFPLVARACGANPVAAAGMVQMCAESILRDMLPRPQPQGGAS